MEYSMNGAPMFNGQKGLKYELWSCRMKVFLQAQGYDVWHSVVTGYNATKKPKTATKKELKRNNKITMDFILEGFPDSVKDKVGKCSSAKELWDKLHNIYSSPITESDIVEEDAGTEQEVRCSSCQTDSEEEEFVVNISEFFFFTCEERRHLEIEFPYLKIESDETEQPNEIEDNPEIEKEKDLEAELISALDELTKERKKNQVT
jgi:hypothetical protein